MNHITNSKVLILHKLFSFIESDLNQTIPTDLTELHGSKFWNQLFGSRNFFLSIHLI